VPAQLEEQVAAGEPLGDPVRGVYGERGLADARHAVHDVDRGVTPLQREVDPADQLGQLAVAAGEPGDVPRQRRDDRRRGTPPVAEHGPHVPGPALDYREQLVEAVGGYFRHVVMTGARGLEIQGNFRRRPAGK
jgi:hypothetical protein